MKKEDIRTAGEADFEGIDKMIDLLRDLLIANKIHPSDAVNGLSFAIMSIFRDLNSNPKEQYLLHCEAMSKNVDWFFSS
jgi:hypothetical protein